jgi:hypothetical protein
MSLCLDETFVYPSVPLPVCLSQVPHSIMPIVSLPTINIYLSPYFCLSVHIPCQTASAAYLYCLFLRLDFPCLADFEPFPPVYPAHGLINNKDTKPKCRLYWCSQLDHKTSICYTSTAPYFNQALLMFRA